MKFFFTALKGNRLVPVNHCPSGFWYGNFLVFDFTVFAFAVASNKEIAFNMRFFIYLARAQAEIGAIFRFSICLYQDKHTPNCQMGKITCFMFIAQFGHQDDKDLIKGYNPYP